MRKRLIVTWLLTLCALVAAGCGGGEPAPDAAAGGEGAASPADDTVNASENEEDSLEGVTLRVGSSSVPDYSDVTLLRLVGQLEERGAQVEVSHFEGDQAPLRALVAGEIDVAAAGVPATIHLAEQTDEGVRVFGVNLQQTDYILVAQPEFTELADLQGEQIGIASPGGISDVLTRLVLEGEGIPLDSVEFVSVGGTGARMSAMASGQLAAGPAHAADALAAVEQSGMSNLWLYADTVDSYLQQGLVSTEGWLAENPELAQTIVDELIDASRWAAENKDEYVELSFDAVDGPSETVRQQAYDIFTDIEMFPVNGGMTEEQLTNTAQIEVDLGNIADLPALETFSDPTFVEDYLDRVGEL